MLTDTRLIFGIFEYFRISVMSNRESLYYAYLI